MFIFSMHQAHSFIESYSNPLRIQEKLRKQLQGSLALPFFPTANDAPAAHSGGQVRERAHHGVTVLAINILLSSAPT